ncbi:hypothetical protein AX16_001368 [Volvariella volvacea WC 439]|nr:hypothetical protein AX16_001368 [Volvariella volvacea WC 439]
MVADPFDEWAQGYKERLRQDKAKVFDFLLRPYEQAQAEVARLKQQYLDKTRRADEAEDDARFAPGGDSYTSSPRSPLDGRRAPPQRTASVSERIAARLRELQKKSSDALSGSSAPDVPPTITEEASTSPVDEESPLPKVDKGKGKATEEELASPLPMSPVPPKIEIPEEPAPPPPILLAGLAFSPAALSSLLSKAASEMPLRSVRFPIIGEYQDCFTGDEFVLWLKDNVQGFGGDLDRAEDAARELTERDNLLRRVGEFGNQFEDLDDAWYQFRPKAFDLDGKKAEAAAASATAVAKSPLKTQPDNALLIRPGVFAGLVSRAMSSVNSTTEPAHIRARQEAQEADKAYRVAVRKLDRQRLGVEDQVEETLKRLQKWEFDRLQALKTVLLQFQGTLATISKTLESSNERSNTLISAYQPESDLTALIERYRTGPFRPNPHVYESVAHDELDVVFGIDLRKWAEGGWHELTGGEEKKDQVPPVFTALLNTLWDAYGNLESDDERRKAWVYEVPLPAVHKLREELNALPPDQPIPEDLILKNDVPVIASVIKLWLLELDPPLALYEGWEEFRKLYPTVGHSRPDGEKSAEDHLSDLKNALLKLPRIHLYVLDALFKHVRELIDNTDVEEDDEVYTSKIALSIGRTIIRPKVETELSIQDRHPTLLVIDLIKHYAVLLPPTIEKKKRESERKVPLRKRTAPVDMRLSRSRISIDANAQELLAAQKLAQNPSLGKRLEQAQSPPPVPQLSFVAPPPPPPLQTQSSATSRPSFKEPPPEVEGLPPRPAFKDPGPDSDEEKTPVRPNFVDPPAEKSEEGTEEDDDDDEEEEGSQAEEKDTAKTPVAPSPGSTGFVAPPPPPSLNAPTPTRAFVPPGPPPALVPGHNKKPSVGAAYQARLAQQQDTSARSPSPASSKGDDDVTLGGGRVSLSRSGSNQGGLRGPRTAGARGHRNTSGSVSSMVQNLNRSGVGGPAPGSPVGARRGGRPSLSSRTMASDAEDDLLDRK